MPVVPLSLSCCRKAYHGTGAVKQKIGSPTARIVMVIGLKSGGLISGAMKIAPRNVSPSDSCHSPTILYAAVTPIFSLTVAPFLAPFHFAPVMACGNKRERR